MADSQYGPKGPGVAYIGSPDWLLLDAWCHDLFLTFESLPYLVGSATKRRDYRDVDVRLILDNDEFEALFPGISASNCAYHTNIRWRSFCTAFALWGQKVTGLPIDFQIISRDDNERYRDEHRIPVGVTLDPAPAPAPAPPVVGEGAE